MMLYQYSRTYEDWVIKRAFNKCARLGSGDHILVTNDIADLPALKMPHVSGLLWDRKVPDKLLDFAKRITDQDVYNITCPDNKIGSFHYKFPPKAIGKNMSKGLFGDFNKYIEMTDDISFIYSKLKKEIYGAENYTGWFHSFSKENSKLQDGGLYNKYHTDLEDIVRAFITYSGERSTRIVTDVIDAADYSKASLYDHALDYDYVEQKYNIYEPEIGQVFFSKGNMICASYGIQSPVHSGAGLMDIKKRVFAAITAEYFRI